MRSLQLLKKIFPFKPATSAEFLAAVKIHNEAALMANRKIWADSILTEKCEQDSSAQVAFVRSKAPDNKNLWKIKRDLQETVDKLKIQRFPQWDMGTNQSNHNHTERFKIFGLILCIILLFLFIAPGCYAAEIYHQLGISFAHGYQGGLKKIVDKADDHLSKNCREQHIHKSDERSKGQSSSNDDAGTTSSDQ